MAYRFFANDAVSFEKSLKVTIGFGKNEDPMFRRGIFKEGNELQLSTMVYWYQKEPHATLPAMPLRYRTDARAGKSLLARRRETSYRKRIERPGCSAC